MRARRYPQRGDDAELFPEAREVLLVGWGAPCEPDPEDPFRIFTLSENDLRRLWRTNRRALMREAQRRGIAEPWGLCYDDDKEQ